MTTNDDDDDDDRARTQVLGGASAWNESKHLRMASLWARANDSFERWASRAARGRVGVVKVEDLARGDAGADAIGALDSLIAIDALFVRDPRTAVRSCARRCSALCKLRGRHLGSHAAHDTARPSSSIGKWRQRPEDWQRDVAAAAGGAFFERHYGAAALAADSGRASRCACAPCDDRAARRIRSRRRAQ